MPNVTVYLPDDLFAWLEHEASKAHYEQNKSLVIRQIVRDRIVDEQRRVLTSGDSEVQLRREG